MSKGFTLMEILIGLGLIGVIAAIATPNLDCLVKQAEDSEAKTELSAVKMAEKIHFTQYKTYTACLKQIGYRPRPDRSFTVGFSANAVTVGMPRCGRSPDPKFYEGKVTQGDGTVTTTSWQWYGNLNCNTWGDKPTNVCNSSDAKVGDPDSASDINFAANTVRGDSIMVSYRNLDAVEKTCNAGKQVYTDVQNLKPRYAGCWGEISNFYFGAVAFRGRKAKDGSTFLSGFILHDNDDRFVIFENNKSAQGY